MSGEGRKREEGRGALTVARRHGGKRGEKVSGEKGEVVGSEKRSLRLVCERADPGLEAERPLARRAV
jgi:hypothetical protein